MDAGNVYTVNGIDALNKLTLFRMAMWKHYVILFGGFYDPGIRSTSSFFYTTRPFLKLFLREANYLNDLWYFDTQEYRWKQVEFKDTERKPSCVRNLNIAMARSSTTCHAAREADFLFYQRQTVLFCMVSAREKNAKFFAEIKA